MSNYWSVYCITCNESHGNERNHGQDGMLAVIAAREVWEQVAEVSEDATVNFDGPGLMDYLIQTSWFLRHRGHILAPRSEYGYLLEDCAEGFRCGECNTPHICRRRKGHAGKHSKVRDYDPSQI